MTDLTFIRAFSRRFEAELAQQYLAGQGIESMVQADDAGGMYAGLSLGRKGVRLLVRTADAEPAREALAALSLASGEMDALDEQAAAEDADGDFGDDPGI